MADRRIYDPGSIEPRWQDHWDREGVYQRVRMAAEMQPDRRVTRYESYVIDTTGRPIRAALKRYWKLSDGTCFSAM